MYTENKNKFKILNYNRYDTKIILKLQGWDIAFNYFVIINADDNNNI